VSEAGDTSPNPSLSGDEHVRPDEETDGEVGSEPTDP
jgi:hypothetical protein